MSRDTRWVAERMLLAWLAGAGIGIAGFSLGIWLPTLCMAAFLVGRAIGSIGDARERL